MKKIVLIPTFIAFILCLGLKAQTPGTLDLSFGTNGIVNISYTGQDVHAQDIAFQSDGNMILCGKMEEYVWATRMDENGIINSSFGNNPGYFIYDFGYDYYGRNLCILPDDKIIIAGDGEIGSYAFVMRLTADGQLDPSFGAGNGFYLFPELNEVRDLKYVTTGSTTHLYIAGYQGTFYDGHPVIIKIDQDGNLINSFGSNGVMILDEIDGAFYGIDIDLSLDMIYAVGKSGEDAMLVRCNQAGQIDPTFGTSGYVIFDEPGTGDELNLNVCIVDQQNHYITCFGSMDDLGGGSTSFDICALRVNSNGTMNDNFGVDGWSYMLVNDDDHIYDAVQQSDGKFYFGGDTEFYNSNDDFLLGRMGHYGFLDPAFGTNGITNLDYGYNESAMSLLLDEENGKLIVAGISFGDDEITAAVARYHTGFAIRTPENPFHNEIQVYPNPVTSYLRIDILQERDSFVEFQLVNSLGMIVQSWNKTQFTVSYQAIELLLTNELTQGMYFLIAKTEEKETMQQKIIVAGK